MKLNINTDAVVKFTNKVGLSIVSGLVSGIAVGYLKEEVYDKRWNKGTYDKKDFYATSWGSAVGSICLVVLIDNNKKKKKPTIINYENI